MPVKMIQRCMRACAALALLLAAPGVSAALPLASPRDAPGVVARAQWPGVTPAQYYERPMPRLVRPRRPLPPRLRGMRPPFPPPRRPRAAPSPGVRIAPSEALRLAQRRWPRSIGLSVRLLRGGKPVYAVKLKAGSRVVLVLVDARTGRVLQ